MSSIIKVDTVQDIDGNNIINENANVITVGASGDTITIPAGATFDSSAATNTLPATVVTTTGTQTLTNKSIATTQLTGTVATSNLGTGTADATTFLRGDNTFASAGGANTPIVRAVPSGNQAISASTNTTVVFNTEVIDTDSAFASNTFTVPSGKAGKYYVSVTIIADTNTDDSLQRVQIRKNTSTNVGYANYQMSGTADNTITVFCIVDLAESDTILVNYYSYSVTSEIKSNAEYAGGTSLNIFKLI